MSAERFQYGNLKASASGLIKKFGQAATLQKMSASGTFYDPTQTSEDHEIQLVQLAFSRFDQISGAVDVNDVRLMVSTEGLTVDIDDSDKIVLSGVTYNIVNVRKTNPGGTLLVYELQCRK